ncbi:TPA: crossover junction endodeoxyribonuclease RuvC [Candidatus Campbellbacteria bacterium]|nr:MAG: crossover junction endodeoxyribonuclease RuvC, crossover junction endodeoxyribonuclease RuvC [Candidatus Campbellbacteria bacterium GW2011_OD1_34_28]KKP75278.1 MAG: Crossover junction endodeoxyribonuclease RuvC [Candidatus Campbellbacteria bacterium GW2011_GWD2_35_24]KKP76161.1 MAG: Crossover junction endodeoxyribonuclease RuvC [Candidatus Campbellbacteria bacterium GW2011_GWC2_35_28]KKP77350.1 MAG: Crossover junction endodeoxyribonuclease RuvC [Candidatus Campbellbacteria bacterium GW20
MKIISIDPGYERVGIAIIEKEGGQKEKLIYSDCFKTSPKLPLTERLFLIGQEINKIIREYGAKALAIETLFFTNNQKTVMGVSEARGVIMYQAMLNKIPVFEYTPLQIKIAVTGYGKSDKKQVTDMVLRLIKIEKEIKHDDEYDAIAVGLTHLASHRN